MQQKVAKKTGQKRRRSDLAPMDFSRIVAASRRIADGHYDQPEVIDSASDALLAHPNGEQFRLMMLEPG